MKPPRLTSALQPLVRWVYRLRLPSFEIRFLDLPAFWNIIYVIMKLPVTEKRRSR